MRNSRISRYILNSIQYFPCRGEIKGDVKLFMMLPLIMVFALLVTGCDESLDPLLENDRYFFSVNGYLDVSADTQWVRVMPVRESINPPTDLPVPSVTLEHVESGETVAMNDSLFHYADGRVVLNYWTTMDILPENTYQLTVEGADGKTSYAETTLPEDYPLPFFTQPEFGADILIVTGVEQLADIQVVYHIQFDVSEVISRISYPHLQMSIQAQSSVYRIPIEAGDLRAQLTEAYCNFSVIERNVFVASGGPGWPDFVTLDRHTIAIPDYLSNIENGLGFFGGIISKTFPYIDVEGDEGLFEVSC